MRALVVFSLCLPLAAEVQLPPAANIKVDFEKHVKPLLAQKCFACHGEDVQQSGLRLDKRQNAMRGGDYGPVIIAGKSAESKLIRKLVSGDGGMQMPPTGPLSKDEIGILRAWIDQGVDFRIEIKDDAPAPAPDPKVAAFIEAIRSDDASTVRKMIAANRDLVNAHDRAGSTPLMHAAAFGSMSTMKLLLDNGADVNAKNRRASTALHWGIRDEARVRLLLDRGARVDAKQADGRTPLYLAASMGNGNAVLKLLLEKGADPGLATANGQTPLITAANRGDVEAMRLLIEKKADVNARSGTGGTALMAAAASRNPRAVQLLLEKGADVNALTKRNEGALANAATAGVEESVKLLVAAGADVNKRDDRGYSPLMYAAASELMPAGIVRMLLEKGADPNCVGEDETAKTLAAKRGNTEVARLLGVSEKGIATAENGGAPADRTIPQSVGKALTLLAKQSDNFIRTAGCNSCHAQDLPSAAVGIARDAGLPAPKTYPQLPLSMTGVTPERIMDLGAVAVTSMGWEMFDLGMNHANRDDYTDATVHYLKAMQTPEGFWKGPEGRRPPMTAGDLQATALAVYSLKHFTPPAGKAETEKAVARAAAWLESAKPGTTQERAFHLMGLVWSGASPKTIERSAAALASAQRADGGWNQLPAMSSDAYATGQAMYALHTAGMAASEGVYRKGVQYLLRTQAEDGSWHVNTRSIWIQPYFDSGFPYGPDQWISAAGTAWASIGLSFAAEAPKVSRR